MSVQRYVTFRDDVLHPIESVDPGDIDTIVVLFTDAEKWVQEAVAAERSRTPLWESLVTAKTEGYEQGQRDEREECAKVVEAAYDSLNYEHTFRVDCECVWCEDGAILAAAIRARGEA